MSFLRSLLPPLLPPCLALTLCALSAATWARSEEPDLQEMWRIIQEQQLEIDNLKRQLQEQQQVLEARHPSPAHSEDMHAHSEGQPHKDAHGSEEHEEHEPLSISGYGELHHVSFDDRNDQVGGDDALSETDFRRFIVSFNYDFTEHIRLRSELELENATVSNEEDGRSGELSLEKVVVQYDVTDRHTFFTGADVLPIGFIHIYHEPSTFYGVDYNPVETEIIPTTWTEGGAGFFGSITDDLDYKLMVHSGLQSPLFDGEDENDDPILHAEALRPRAGRGKASLARDRDIAMTGRLRWRGLPGLDTAISGHYQSDMTGTADETEVSATLFTGQFEYLHPTGLYGRWDFEHSP